MGCIAGGKPSKPSNSSNRLGLCCQLVVPSIGVAEIGKRFGKCHGGSARTGAKLRDVTVYLRGDDIVHAVVQAR